MNVGATADRNDDFMLVQIQPSALATELPVWITSTKNRKYLNKLFRSVALL